jgi:hypothetical protein
MEYREACSKPKLFFVSRPQESKSSAAKDIESAKFINVSSRRLMQFRHPQKSWQYHQELSAAQPQPKERGALARFGADGSRTPDIFDAHRCRYALF